MVTLGKIVEDIGSFFLSFSLSFFLKEKSRKEIREMLQENIGYRFISFAVGTGLLVLVSLILLKIDEILGL